MSHESAPFQLPPDQPISVRITRTGPNQGKLIVNLGPAVRERYLIDLPGLSVITETKE